MDPKDKVFTPGQNRIFVFGSNLAGIHGAGAARTAYELYGATWGKGEGLSYESYAIPTKNGSLETLTLDIIRQHVDTFLEYAWEHQELYFFITRIGCGLAGYTDEEISPMFAEAPANCELPNGWRGEAQYQQEER